MAGTITNSMIVAIRPDETPEIAAFIERTIDLSVDATVTQKEAFITNVRANLGRWRQDPAGALHLKMMSCDARLASPAK